MGGSKRLSLWLAAIAAVVLLSGCSAVNPALVDPIASALDGSGKNRVEIDLRTSLDFDWDELGIICAFTTNDTVEKGLGFSWPGAPEVDSFNRNLLVFANGGQVVAWTEVPSRISFCTYGSESTDGIRIVLRADSQMTFVRTTVDDPIGANDEYWLVDPKSVVVARSALEGVPLP